MLPFTIVPHYGARENYIPGGKAKAGTPTSEPELFDAPAPVPRVCGQMEMPSIPAGRLKVKRNWPALPRRFEAGKAASQRHRPNTTSVTLGLSSANGHGHAHPLQLSGAHPGARGLC